MKRSFVFTIVLCCILGSVSAIQSTKTVAVDYDTGPHGITVAVDYDTGPKGISVITVG